MEWTTEKPTKPGYYWTCDTSMIRLGWPVRTEIIEVIDTLSDNERLLIVQMGNNDVHRDTDYYTHFIGPIEVPEPSKEQA